jgi:hypothetical protein
MTAHVVPLRLLYIEDIQFVGWADGPNHFHVAWEFLFQLGIPYKTPSGVVPAFRAKALAKALDRPLDRDWGFMLYMWNDETGERARELAAFLRRGPCAIVDNVNKKRVAKRSSPKPKSKNLTLGPL